MSRGDWLWVGCKLLGTCVLVLGAITFLNQVLFTLWLAFANREDMAGIASYSFEANGLAFAQAILYFLAGFLLVRKTDAAVCPLTNDADANSRETEEVS